MNRIQAQFSEFERSTIRGMAAGAPGGGRLAGPAPSEGGVRWELIRRLRQEIAAGTYASEERWAQALARLSESLER